MVSDCFVGFCCVDCCFLVVLCCLVFIVVGWLLWQSAWACGLCLLFLCSKFGWFVYLLVVLMFICWSLCLFGLCLVDTFSVLNWCYVLLFGVSLLYGVLVSWFYPYCLLVDFGCFEFVFCLFVYLVTFMVWWFYDVYVSRASWLLVNFVFCGILLCLAGWCYIIDYCLFDLFVWFWCCFALFIDYD